MCILKKIFFQLILIKTIWSIQFDEIIYQTDLIKIKENLRKIDALYDFTLYKYNELGKNALKFKELEISNQDWDPNDQVFQSVTKKLIEYFKNELERYNKTVDDLEIQIRNLQSKSNVEEKNREGFLYDDEKIVDCSSIKGNGIIQIEIETKLNHKPIMLNVQCENKWIVIQQRQNGFETSFNRTWNEYINGFNSLGHDFWLGLEFIHVLTQQNQQTELLIELTDWHDQIFLAHYDNFKLGPIDDYYRLHLSPNFNGNASKDYIDDSYFGLSSQNGTPFSTYDKINAEKHYKNFKNCPSRSGGGWWFNNFSNCLPVNLNGIYVSGASAPSAKGIKWQAIRPLDRNYALKKSKMKIRHKQS